MSENIQPDKRSAHEIILDYMKRAPGLDTEEAWEQYNLDRRAAGDLSFVSLEDYVPPDDVEAE